MTKPKPKLAAGRKPPKKAAAAITTKTLLHELEVHQIELEVQNEELRTSRRAAESALERYTEVFEFAPIGYAAIADDGTIAEINHAGAALFRTERARLTGRRLPMLVAAESLVPLDELLAAARRQADPARGELVLRGRGRPVPVAVTAVALRRTEPTLLLAFWDISDRLANEAELARSEQALREANHRKDEFLAMLSHELRNPLAPLRTSVSILQLAEPGSEAARTATDIIDRSSDHLVRLVDDLLDVTRIMRGKIHLQRTPMDLVKLVRRTVEDHRARLANSRLELDLQVQADTIWIDGDPARIVQVLSNLLGNAEKFTPSGGRVAVVVEQVGGSALVRVIDSGIGIPAALLPDLFEPFVQVPQSLDRNRGGLGLGLALVKSIIELHGGRVNLQSDGPGCGTQASFVLPVMDALPLMAREQAKRRVESHRRVLIIEDNPDAARTLGDALELCGHIVEIALEGRRGLDIAETFHPEVVLCDIGLPDLDGYEVARRFRATETLRDTHLFALSGYARPEDVSRSRAAGFDGHIAKPARIDELDRMLSNLADGAAAHPADNALH